MDTYEKKYNEALERAKEWATEREQVICPREIVESIFPELRESEEDENNLNKLLQWDGVPLGLRSWVSGLPKKLGTRPSWKPSEEQMKSLKWWCDTYKDTPGGNELLYSLYNDLKKL